jgi:glycosyltransferase involved in cell wall biosynthesis
VPVLAVRPPADLEPGEAVAQLLDWAAAAPPRAVVFWNVIAEHKVLMADALFDVPVFDVSPGEMYFASLDRYFRRPRGGLPYATPAEYGERLAGVVVKYGAEAARARAVLGAPVHVIPNGVALPATAPPGPASGVLRIGTLARLDPRKRLDHLIEGLRRATPRLPPHRLLIGGGPEPGAPGHGDELRRLAEGLSVELVGEVEPGAFLAGLDLFALVAEPAGCPNASLEALARGLPVVATDAGGMGEQIEGGVSGRLVPREDAEALAEAFVALGTDAPLRARLGAAGRERVRARFSLERMADAYLEVLLGEVRAQALRGSGRTAQV